MFFYDNINRNIHASPAGRSAIGDKPLLLTQNPGSRQDITVH